MHYKMFILEILKHLKVYTKSWLLPHFLHIFWCRKLTQLLKEFLGNVFRQASSCLNKSGQVSTTAIFHDQKQIVFVPLEIKQYTW